MPRPIKPAAVASKPGGVASKPRRYYFKDFATGERRYTRGQFAGWQKDGPLGAWGVYIIRRGGGSWIPEYCLTAESRALLPKRPA